MKSFKQFTAEEKSKSKPDTYFHVGPANLKKGEDLLSMKDQHGEHKAFNKFVKKWDPIDKPGIESDIEHHISHVHMGAPGYFFKGDRPNKGQDFSKDEYGSGKKTALYKIKATPEFNKTTIQHKGDSFDAASSVHYKTPRVPANLITHRWNHEKNDWEPWNQ